MILAIESASTDLSVAIAAPDGEILAQDGWTSDRRQGHELLPRLLALLAAHGHDLDDVGALAVGLGPGSFTGLRVGMSLAKGLALALDRPIVGVPSLQAWLRAEPDATAALARAGAHEAYLLQRGEDEPRIVESAATTKPVVAAAELATAFGLANALPPYGAAAAVAAMAATRLEQSPTGDDLAGLEPTYLRAPRGAGQLVGA
jgi:tRNA threonylcarbamoyl adenosine modification protein YeaZ